MIKTKTRLKAFPLLRFLKGYTWDKFKLDFWAGMNVSLLDFPQAMAYALLAGFPVMFGVYASTIGSLVGPILSSSRYLMLGATNATSVLVLSSLLAIEMPENQRLFALPILVLLVGLFLILGSFMRLAGFIKYISRTVIIGYITAAALLIIVNQLSTILGTPPAHATTFFNVLTSNILNYKNIQLTPLLIALLTGFVYLIFKSYFKTFFNVALTLIVVSIICAALNLLGTEIPMINTEEVGLQMPQLPKFSFEIVYQMGGPAMAVAFLVLLEGSSIAKTLAAKTGGTVDLNQNMLSLGASNVASAFVSGMPVSGSLTRSILNLNSKAATPISSIVSGIIMIISIILFGPFLKFIPKASLAIIVISVGISLISFEQIKIVLRSTKVDAAVFFITFLGGLFFPLTMAIGLGAAASIILFLKKVSEPHLMQYTFNEKGELTEHDVKVPSDVPEISIVHIEGELFFGSTDIFLDQIRLICSSPNLKVIILKMRNAIDLDASSAFAMLDLIRFAHQKGRYFIVSGANKNVEAIFRSTGVMELLGENNFFRYTPENPNISTRSALKRAQELIGPDKARILLFTQPENHDSNEPSSVHITTS